MNKICNDYCQLIKDNFCDIVNTIIIYGSNIYNASSSDLDVCLIVDSCNEEQKQEIINKSIEFHKQHSLKIDEEIPHNNKLIYTKEEVLETLNTPPFYENNNVVIHDIVKTEKFLSSKEMKQRLLLNILTTDHLTVGQSTSKYELLAFKIMIDVVTRYYNLNDKSAEKILDCLYQNQYTGAEGEMYLGYKKNYKQKEKYLLKKINEVLND